MIASKQASWLLTGSLVAGLLSAGFIGSEDSWQSAVAPSASVSKPMDQGDFAESPSSIDIEVEPIEMSQLQPVGMRSGTQTKTQFDRWMEERTVWR